MSFKELDKIIMLALKEDAAQDDITTDFLVARNQISEGYIICKENAVVCGLDIARRVLQKLDKNIQFRSLYHDGDHVKINSKVALIKGRTRALLSGERVALNFLGHLSGIATLTAEFVQKAKGSQTKIMDTRKTIPGLRVLQKYAVRCGGG